MKSPNVLIETGLEQAFLESVIEGNPLQFSADSLFSRWFRKNGKSYFFLFHKNLSRTNIQYAELGSLITLHTTNNATQKPETALHFILVKDFLNGVQQVVTDLARSTADKDLLCKTFLDLYPEVLRRTVLLDMFHGSCSVFFPPHLDMDLFKVCSESGYIHSCGHNVYARQLAKTDDSEFKEKVKAYLKPITKRVFFAVYSHEDFTRYDGKHSSYLRGGLDDVKIYAEKYFVGNKPLVRVLHELKSEAPDKIFLAEAGDYHKHGEQMKANRTFPGRSLWLIVDRVVSEQRGMANEEQFLICYDQRYKNKNPLHLFDENKPAWVAHTTIPHTLAGAMINVTRTAWPEGTVSIYDPFSGTGTTALEAVKFENVRMTCNDKSPIAAQLLKDNQTFFAMSHKRLEGIVSTLTALSKENYHEYMHSPTHHNSTSGPGPYKWAIALYDELEKTAKPAAHEEWFDVGPEIVKELKGATFEMRLCFYLALRTKLRHVAAFERRSDQWVNAYRKEVQELHFQATELIDIRKRLRKSTKGGFVKCLGTYSDACTLNPVVFNRKGAEHLTITKGEATVQPTGKFDVIITDPPYGFNNDLSALQLAQLLSHTLDVIMRGLKPKAQVIIALPDRSHSGRRIPLFATRTWVTQQVISKAEEHGFEASTPARILPHLGDLFQPPYYWNSEKALSRAILHFQFVKKPNFKGMDGRAKPNLRRR